MLKNDGDWINEKIAHIQAKGFNILGELPEVTVNRENEPILQGSGKDFQRYQESIHSIRTNIMIDKSLRDQRLITVTSLTPNEGKSSCCLQLHGLFPN